MNALARLKLVFTLGCRDASRLLSDGTERKLTLTERLALRIHLGICRACRRYRRYLGVIRSALKGPTPARDDESDAAESLVTDLESDGRLSEDAKRRLKSILERA